MRKLIALVGILLLGSACGPKQAVLVLEDVRFEVRPSGGGFSNLVAQGTVRETAGVGVQLTEITWTFEGITERAALNTRLSPKSAHSLSETVPAGYTGQFRFLNQRVADMGVNIRGVDDKGNTVQVSTLAGIYIVTKPNVN